MNETKVGVGTRPGQIYVGYAGRPGKWAKFKSRRVWGIPAPVIASVVALLLFAGAAIAAVLFSAKATVDGNVSDDIVVTWDGTPAFFNVDGVVVSADTAGNALHLHVTQGYRNGSFDLFSYVTVPNGGSPNVKIQGINLGSPTVFDVMLLNTYAPSGEYATGNTAGTPKVIGDALVGSNNIVVKPWASVKRYILHLKITIKSDAPTGAFGSATELVPGLQVILA